MRPPPALIPIPRLLSMSYLPHAALEWFYRKLLLRLAGWAAMARAMARVALDTEQVGSEDMGRVLSRVRKAQVSCSLDSP